MNRMRTIGTSLLIASIATACASPRENWDASARGWIGSPLAKLIEVYGEPVSIKGDPNGERAARYELREIAPTCVQTWVIDRNNIITGQFHSGPCNL